MKQFISLVFILTCKLAVSKVDFYINHGDSHSTRIYEGNLFRQKFMTVNTDQDNDGGLYSIENIDTGVVISYLLPIETTKEDSTLSQSQSKYTSVNGQTVKFSYATAKKETRKEELEINASNEIKVKGTFSYVDPNGYNYLQGYEADENGYRTKVSFGTKIMYIYSGIEQTSAAEPAKPPGGKGIDGTLLCSLGGSGCRK